MNSPELESTVLGGILYWNGSLHAVSAVLKPEHFYDDWHRAVYASMIDMDGEGGEPDLPSLWAWMVKCGKTSVSDAYRYGCLTNNPCKRVNLEFNARILVQYYIQRKLTEEGMALSDKSSGTGVDPFEVAAELDERVNEMMTEVAKRSTIAMRDVAVGGMERLDNKEAEGHPTGLHSLDVVTGGYQAGDLVILAGRPAMGKTSAMLSSVHGSAVMGRRSLVFSLEVPEDKLGVRMSALDSGVPLRNILKKDLSEEQLHRLHEAHERYAALPIFWNFNTGITLSQIKAEVANHIRRHGITAVFIDQLNWIQPPKGSNRNEVVGDITRGLKKIAMQYGVPIILLHQLNRVVTGMADKRPQLHHLRDSGNVEQDAQLVIFAHRPEYYGEMEDDMGSTIGRKDLIVAKQSMGELATVSTRFNGATASIHDDWNQQGTSPF